MNSPEPVPLPPGEVWLIEDNEPFRRAASRVIQCLEGVRAVRGFGSCEAAFNAIAQGGRPDIVLLDVGLPGMSGLEGISHLKRQVPAAQVIVLTVFDDAEKVFSAICAGAAGYLLKGSSFQGIREALTEIRRGGAPMNGRIAKMVLQAFQKDRGVPVNYGLTPREREILEALVRGYTKKEIAAQLDVSFHTVDFHQRSIYQKLHVHVPAAALKRLPAHPGLSVHYSESENSRVGVERIDLNGRSLAPVSGLTKEKGFTLSFLDQKISVRANWYETQQLNDDSGLASQFLTMIGPITSLFPSRVREETIANNRLNQPDIATLRNYPGLPDYIVKLLNFRVNPDGLTTTIDVPSGLTVTSDLVSKGFELELVANITSNWRVMFNAAQQKVTSANTGPQLAKFIGEAEAILAIYGKFPAGPTSTETLGDFVNRVGLIAAKTKISEDGADKTNEVREWRANIVTNYEFARESKLRGWNLGSAVRWQDKVGIGRPVINDPKLGYISDLNNPFYGPTELKVDGWLGYTRNLTLFGRKTQWSAQLNVRNVLGKDELIPVFANPDGTIPVIRIPEDRTWELRTSFVF